MGEVCHLPLAIDTLLTTSFIVTRSRATLFPWDLINFKWNNQGSYHYLFKKKWLQTGAALDVEGQVIGLESAPKLA